MGGGKEREQRKACGFITIQKEADGIRRKVVCVGGREKVRRMV